MERLSSHLLLSIFKWLNSLGIVGIRPVCKNWLEITEENRSLWRRPILPATGSPGWPASALELFDRKSQSGLTEVSISSLKAESKEDDLLVQLLEKSKHSLRFLSTQVLDNSKHFFNLESPIPDLSWKLPHLVEFKVFRSQQEPEPRILLRWNEFEGSNGLGSVQNLSNLKVLRGYNFPNLFKSHPYLLNNISSLCVFYLFESSEWRKILEVPSKTLKHLFMKTPSDSDSNQLSTLHFPRLKVLQTWSNRFLILPTWLDVPTTSILISELGFPLYLPSISILCIPDLRGIQGLKSRCPLLVELEFGRKDLENSADTYPELVNELILVLKERKQQSEDGFEVDGVQMTSLKRLVIPFNQFAAQKLEELRDSVEELVDLDSVSPFIEMEV